MKQSQLSLVSLPTLEILRAQHLRLLDRHQVDQLQDQHLHLLDRHQVDQLQYQLVAQRSLPHWIMKLQGTNFLQSSSHYSRVNH